MPCRTYEPLPALAVVDPPADALAFDSANDGSGFTFARVERVVAAEALALAWLLS
jgi:hypothetical protein